VLAQGPPEPPLTHAILDKGDESHRLRAHLLAPDIGPVLPPKSNRTEAIAYNTDLYKLREKVERFCNNRKQFRRIATRYEQRSQTFLACIHLVAAWIIIK
jgi:putative transposase